MESSISYDEGENTSGGYRFVASSGAHFMDEEERDFCGAGFIDPGPSFARCQPIENSFIISSGETPVSDVSELPSQIIFKIVSKSYALGHDDCTVGIHTNVNHRCFFDRWKNRIGHEISVHGHRVCDMEIKKIKKKNGTILLPYGRRISKIVSDVKETKNTNENEKDWVDKEWANGDIIKLVFTNPILKWYWNGIEQSSIDISNENRAIRVAKFLNGGYQGGSKESDYINPKWCFYARGVAMRICIDEQELNDQEYEVLRHSYAERYKKMKDHIDEEEKTWSWDDL